MLDKDVLLQTLCTLPHKHGVAFAASCCERLVPNYNAFALMEGWGNPDVLQEALNAIWAFLEGANLEEGRIRELIEACKAVAPHSDDFGSAFVGAAIDAYAAIVYTLEYCQNKDTKLLVYIAKLVIDTLDEYLFIVNFPKIGLFAHDFAFDEWAKQAPLMIAEIEKQRQDLEALKGCTNLDSDFLANLRHSSSLVGIHPVKRGLVIEQDGE